MPVYTVGEATLLVMPQMRNAALIGIVLFVAGLVTSCAPGEVRDGCIEENMQDSGFTEEFARSVCESEFEIYGNKRPPIDQAIDDFEDEVSVFECMAKFDFDPAMESLCDLNRTGG